MNKPIVSICCMTYNHEKYIRDCLDGFISQKTSFSYEIIVHDDASKDNTANIVREYEKNNPLLFKCIYQDENQYHKQHILSNILFKKSLGKYIALCEGDDYWSDPNKLQTQFDFMERNPNFSMCFHNAIIINETTGDSHVFRKYMKKEFTGVDILNDWLIPTSSTFFKNLFPVEYKGFFDNVTHGDLSLFLYLSVKGNIGFINENMSVYRVNEGGITNSFFNGIEHNLKHIAQLETLIKYLGSYYKKQLVNRLIDYLVITSYLQTKAKDKNFKVTFLNATKLNFPRVFLKVKYIVGILYFMLKNKINGRT